MSKTEVHMKLINIWWEGI